MHRSTRLFYLSLALWFALSLSAAWSAARVPLAGLMAGVSGGLAIGFLSARRVDPRRTRTRVGRRRRRSTGGVDGVDLPAGRDG
jgi:hypothetical protein